MARPLLSPTSGRAAARRTAPTAAGSRRAAWRAGEPRVRPKAQLLQLPPPPRRAQLGEAVGHWHQRAGREALRRPEHRARLRGGVGGVGGGVGGRGGQQRERGRRRRRGARAARWRMHQRAASRMARPASARQAPRQRGSGRRRSPPRAAPLMCVARVWAWALRSAAIASNSEPSSRGSTPLALLSRAAPPPPPPPRPLRRRRRRRRRRASLVRGDPTSTRGTSGW